MNRFSAEQKLHLVEQIRNQYQQDQLDLNRRKLVLYGDSIDHNSTTPDNTALQSSFRMRALIALMLVVIIILLDTEDSEILGINSVQVFSGLEYDYMSQIEEFVSSRFY